VPRLFVRTQAVKQIGAFITSPVLRYHGWMARRGAVHEVWARVAWALVDTASRAGVSPATLFEGLPFDEPGLRRLARVSWAHYCSLLERFETLAGGPEAFERLLQERYHLAFPEARAAARALVSPKQMMRIACELTGPILFPPVDVRIEDKGPDRLRISLALRPGARPCTAYFRGTTGAFRGVPYHLGLPAAEIEADVGPGHGTYDVLLPPSRTLVARLGYASRAGFDWLTLRLVLGQRNGSPIRFTLGPGERPELRDRLDAARSTWRLSQRQTEVLAHVANGAANKEIALALSCSEATVEAHVTQLLRRADVSSRARLIAAFWRGWPEP
jgi:DNA-binding CsgD family transcriptional regulator